MAPHAMLIVCMCDRCTAANTYLKLTNFVSAAQTLQLKWLLSIFWFVRLSKWSFSLFVFLCCCCLSPCMRLPLPFSKARILLVSTHRPTLSTRSKSVAQTGCDWSNRVARCMSRLALWSFRCWRSTFAFNFGWITNNHYRTWSVVYEVVRNAAKNGAFHFAETTCSHDDHNGRRLLNNLADHFTCLSRCCTQCSWNLRDTAWTYQWQSANTKHTNVNR